MASQPSWAAQLGAPALAGGIAVCFSHPLELTKVRLQLDNERAARGTPRMYSGWVDCVLQNWRADGLKGVQRGLSLGIAREVCFNAVRIGLLEPMLGVVHSGAARLGWVEEAAAPGPSERLAAGLTCGALGLVSLVGVLAFQCAWSCALCVPACLLSRWCGASAEQVQLLLM